MIRLPISKNRENSFFKTSKIKKKEKESSMRSELIEKVQKKVLVLTEWRLTNKSEDTKKLLEP